jgi:hypothetical protein
MLAEAHTGNGSMETIGGTNATKGIRPANPRTSAGTGTSFKFTKDFFSTCIPELLAPDFSPEALPCYIPIVLSQYQLLHLCHLCLNPHTKFFGIDSLLLLFSIWNLEKQLQLHQRDNWKITEEEEEEEEEDADDPVAKLR